MIPLEVYDLSDWSLLEHLIDELYEQLGEERFDPTVAMDIIKDPNVTPFDFNDKSKTVVVYESLEFLPPIIHVMGELYPRTMNRYLPNLYFVTENNVKAEAAIHFFGILPKNILPNTDGMHFDLKMCLTSEPGNANV